MTVICRIRPFLKGNKRGFVSLAVLAGMTLIGFMGLGVAQVMTTHQEIRLRQILYQQAYYINQAGLEYSIRKIWEGMSSNVAAPGISFAGGTFTSNRAGNIITVTANAGEAQVIHQVVSPTQADCMNVNMANVDVEGPNEDKIEDIWLYKICLASITIASLVVTWAPDNGEAVNEMKIDSDQWDIFPETTSGQTTDLVPDWVETNTGQNKIKPLHFHPFNMHSKNVQIVFNMGDGSTKVVNFVTPPDD